MKELAYLPQFDKKLEPDNRVIFPGNFEILSPHNFVDDFREIGFQAKHRLWAQTMYMNPGAMVDNISEVLIKGVEKGVDSKFQIDYYTFMINGKSMVSLPSFNRKSKNEKLEGIKNKRAALEELKNRNVNVRITNTPLFPKVSFPFLGRNHIKLAIADDVAWVGGLSYQDEDFDKEDFMMRLTDPSIVNVLANQFDQVNESRATKDQFIPCNDETYVMTDRGDRGKSLILDVALNLVGRATQNVKLTTQFALNGEMEKTLYEAYKQGVDVTVYVSENESISEFYGRELDRFNKKITKIRRPDFPYAESKKRIHAKTLLVDFNQNGDGVGIIGSHNFVGLGVTLGTAELSILSRNGNFLSNVNDYLNKINSEINNRVPAGNIYSYTNA